MVNYKQAWRTVPGYIKAGGNPSNIQWYNGEVGYKADVQPKKYSTNVYSQLYILHDLRKPGWSKLGLAAYGGNRIGQYLTSDPYRDIKPWITWTMLKTEATAVEKYLKKTLVRSYEWFNMEPHQLAEFVSEEIERNNYETSI